MSRPRSQVPFLQFGVPCLISFDEEHFESNRLSKFMFRGSLQCRKALYFPLIHHSLTSCLEKKEPDSFGGSRSLKIHGYHPVMSIFDAYDQEFNSLCQEISKNISELKGCSSNDTDKIAVSMRQIEGLISQAGDLTKQMEVEVRSHDPATRKVLLDKVNQYKKSLTTHKSDYER